jgi:uncharacterized membrane protein
MSQKPKSFLKKHYLAALIVMFATFGFIAAFTLSVDKIYILMNPNESLPCNVNQIFNCGTVMRSAYASVYGIPWSFFGVAGYPAVGLFGLFMLERSKISRWLAVLVTLGSFVAFTLSSYFIWLSAYVIGVFCPWCLLSAISSTAAFFLILTLNLKENNYNLPENRAIYFQKKIKAGWNVLLTVIWYLGMVAFAYFPFWNGSR